jgi:hypothetical protein
MKGHPMTLSPRSALIGAGLLALVACGTTVSQQMVTDVSLFDAGLIAMEPVIQPLVPANVYTDLVDAEGATATAVANLKAGTVTASSVATLVAAEIGTLQTDLAPVTDPKVQAGLKAMVVLVDLIGADVSATTTPVTASLASDPRADMRKWIDSVAKPK